MIKCRDAKYVHNWPLSEQRIDKGRDSRALCEQQQSANNKHDDEDWREPKFFSDPKEGPQFSNKAHRDLLELVLKRFRAWGKSFTFDPVAVCIRSFQPQFITANKAGCECNWRYENMKQQTHHDGINNAPEQ